MSPRARAGNAVKVVKETSDVGSDESLVRSLAAWFEVNARDLPWRRLGREPKSGAAARAAQRDPYKSLVSELMLQQTQVWRVVPKFNEFIERFPTVQALAAASEDRVLAAWTGLGYYRRAKLLHAAAKEIVERHAGRVPEMAIELTTLPGVGRYTAGAIASIVFGTPEPIVDGNVSRVLMRVRGKDLASDDPEAVRWAWAQASGLVAIAGQLDVAQASTPKNSSIVSRFNEGLMELGATVCTPEGPRCLYCPWRDVCVARAAGTQDRIPRAKSAAKRQAIVYATVVVRDDRGRMLMERRPQTGLWAGLWQTPTLESGSGGAAKAVPTAAAMARWIGLPGDKKPKAQKKSSIRRTDEFVFHTTHREVRFVVFEALTTDPASLLSDSRRWCEQAELADMALSSPMRRILGLP